MDLVIFEIDCEVAFGDITYELVLIFYRFILDVGDFGRINEGLLFIDLMLKLQ